MAKTGKIVNPTTVLYQPAFCRKPIRYQAIKSSHGGKQHGASRTPFNCQRITCVTTNRTDYVTMVKYLANSVSVPIERFEGSELSKMYYIDTSACVMGKHKLKYNPMNLYSLFGQYCGKTSKEMKNAMLAEINKN